MHFAANCGNIIRRYCFAAEYALVAQPVEHLTFNQRARDSSSLERTKIPRGIVRFLVDFPFSGALHTFCTPAGKPCFFLHCLHSVHRGGTCRGKAPPSCCARPLRRLKAPLGLSLLRCACKREFSYLPRDTSFKKGRRTKHCAAALKVEIVLL